MTESFILRSESIRHQAAEFILNLPDKPVYEVTVKPYRKKRSLQANAYYWGVCIPTLSAHFGYRHDEMHTAILGTYTGWQGREFRGHTIYTPRRTSTNPKTMDTVDFMGLIQTAQQIAAEEGLILPDQKEIP